MILSQTYSAILIKSIGFLFIVLFVYAAVSKLLDFETFTVQLAQSPLLSAYAGFIAWTVPGIEILIACLLILERFRTVALYASFTLMVMFTAYILIILNFSDFIPCSCGGVLEKLSWTQHLIFNIVFLFLAALAILWAYPPALKKKLLLLSLIAVMGTGMVTLFFVISEEMMHFNNAFQRRYMPHALERIGEFDLQSTSKYIVGMDSESIYLGNYNAPLYLEEVNLLQKSIKKYRVSVTDTNLPYRRVRISVYPPHFYVGDGTVPILYRGNIDERKAYPYYSQTYFTHFTIVDSSNFGLVALNGNTHNTALVVVNMDGQFPMVANNDSILKKQIDGIFDSEGSLHWNDSHQNFIYVYRYRNSFEVIDKKLNHLYSSKTIDTISQAILDLAYYPKSQQYVLGSKSVVVNKLSATYGDYLFIESDRLGKFDDEDSVEVSTIIDVYNIKDHSYSFSFFMHHEDGEELKSFAAFENRLIAIIGENLKIYKLKPEYFNSGPN